MTKHEILFRGRNDLVIHMGIEHKWLTMREIKQNIAKISRSREVKTSRSILKSVSKYSSPSTSDDPRPEATSPLETANEHEILWLV